MKVYLLDDPAAPAHFARFSILGTWVDDRICGNCGEPTSRLIEPLQVEWDEGTDKIGDFSWSGYHCIVVEAVRTFLVSNEFEAEFGQVKVMEPTEIASRPRVPFPYDGPPLSWLKPTASLKVDVHKSGIRLLSDCSSCSQKRYTFKREGLVFPKTSWQGESIFTVEQFSRSRATFITENALKQLTNAEFSNLCPRVAGRIET